MRSATEPAKPKGAVNSILSTRKDVEAFMRPRIKGCTDMYSLWTRTIYGGFVPFRVPPRGGGATRPPRQVRLRAAERVPRARATAARHPL